MLGAFFLGRMKSALIDTEMLGRFPSEQAFSRLEIDFVQGSPSEILVIVKTQILESMLLGIVVDVESGLASWKDVPFVKIEPLIHCYTLRDLIGVVQNDTGTMRTAIWPLEMADVEGQAG